MRDRVFLVAVQDETTGLMINGTLLADSEVEARERIIRTFERCAIRTQRIDYDRIPEGMSPMVEGMHNLAKHLDVGAGSAYHIGGIE